MLQLLRQEDTRHAETNKQVVTGEDFGSIRRDQHLLDVRHVPQTVPRTRDDAVKGDEGHEDRKGHEVGHGPLR